MAPARLLLLLAALLCGASACQAREGARVALQLGAATAAAAAGGAPPPPALDCPLTRKPYSRLQSP